MISDDKIFEGCSIVPTYVHLYCTLMFSHRHFYSRHTSKCIMLTLKVSEQQLWLTKSIVWTQLKITISSVSRELILHPPWKRQPGRGTGGNHLWQTVNTCHPKTSDKPICNIYLSDIRRTRPHRTLEVQQKASISTENQENYENPSNIHSFI